ncbi:MAG: hypothetical protein SNG02_04755 [Rikenellaceae bacterium]
MKKFKLSFAAFAFFAVSCSGGSPRIVTDVEANDLRGSVKSVVENGGLLVTTYNEDGWIQERQKRSYASPDLYPEVKYTYAEDNSTIISRVDYTYNQFKSYADTTACNITAQQRMLDKEEEGVEYLYNNAGYLAKSVKYVRKENGDHRKVVEEFRYNTKGRVLKHTTTVYHRSGTDGDDTDLSKLKYVKSTASALSYTYNPQGDPSEVVLTDAVGNMINTQNYLYEYDSNNNWTVKWGGLMRSKSIKREIIYY